MASGASERDRQRALCAVARTNSKIARACSSLFQDKSSKITADAQAQGCSNLRPLSSSAATLATLVSHRTRRTRRTQRTQAGIRLTWFKSQGEYWILTGRSGNSWSQCLS